MNFWDDIQESKYGKRFFKFTFLAAPEYSDFISTSLKYIVENDILKKDQLINICLHLETACINIYPINKGDLLSEQGCFFKVQLKDQKSYARTLSRLSVEETYGETDSERLWALHFHRGVLIKYIELKSHFKELPIVFTYYSHSKNGDVILVEFDAKN